MSLSSPFNGEGRNAVILHQTGGDFILRRERIRGAQHDVGAPVTQRDCQVRGFAGDVQARGDAQSLERLLLDEALANRLQNGHLLVGPLDFALAALGESHILHIARKGMRGCHGNASKLNRRFYLKLIQCLSAVLDHLSIGCLLALCDYGTTI